MLILRAEAADLRTKGKRDGRGEGSLLRSRGVTSGDDLQPIVESDTVKWRHRQKGARAEVLSSARIGQADAAAAWQGARGEVAGRILKNPSARHSEVQCQAGTERDIYC